MSYVIGLRCLGCGVEYSHLELRYQCDACGGVLDPLLDYPAVARALSRRRIRSRPPIIWRKWKEFLPVEDESLMQRVSLSEYETPLLKSPKLAKVVGVRELFVKNDSYFPTCSLKDRSMPIVVEKALEFGADTVCITSAGNAAASLAAYAARAGLESVLFVEKREGVPSAGQLAQMLACGAKVVLLEQIDEQVIFDLRDKYGWYQCDGQINPFRLEGKKTYAFEVWDQMGGRLPDRIVVPVGVGNAVVAIWKGLNELVEVRLADRLPLITGVESQACAPIGAAYLTRGKGKVQPVPQGETICSIAGGDPGIAGDRTLAVLRECAGQTAVASDEDLIKAIKLLASEGIVAEPAGVLALAGLLRLGEKGLVSEDETVVVLVTGHGLKHPEVILEHSPKPVSSLPSAVDIERALGYL